MKSEIKIALAVFTLGMMFAPSSQAAVTELPAHACNSIFEQFHNESAINQWSRHEACRRGLDYSGDFETVRQALDGFRFRSECLALQPGFRQSACGYGFDYTKPEDELRTTLQAEWDLQSRIWLEATFGPGTPAEIEARLIVSSREMLARYLCVEEDSSPAVLNAALERRFGTDWRTETPDHVDENCPGTPGAQSVP